MAVCTGLRICTANLNNAASLYKTVAETVVDTARTKVGFAWAEAKTLGATLHNRLTRFAEYDYVTQTVGTEYGIDDTSGGSANDCEAISMVRLSDGRLIVAYGLFGCQSKESSDHGATWSGARVAVDGVSGLSTRAMCSLGTDGVSVVWCITQERAGGGGSRVLYATKRTGVDTWDTAGRKTIHTAGGFATPPYFIPDNSSQTGPRMLLIKPDSLGLIQCFVGDFVDTGPTYKIRCLWTVDGWATVNSTDVKTFVGGSATARMPKLRLGLDGRVRCTWVDDAGGVSAPNFAYSDDFGQTWTIIGTPSPIASNQGWGVGGNRGFALDPSDGWIVSTMDNEGESPGAYQHRVFRGGDTLSNWTEADCTLAFNAWLGNAGEANLAGTKYLRVYGGIDGSDIKNVSILIETVDLDTGGGAPPLVEEAPSGADVANIYIRLRLAEKRGWSVHTISFATWAVWPEGDYTTQRRLDTLVAAAGSIDPSVDDPAHLAAIYKVDDIDRYTREVFASDTDGSTIVRGDPFPFEVETADIPFGGDFNIGLLRCILIRYRRPSTSFRLDILVDGSVIQSEDLPPSWPESNEKLISIRTDENMGTHFRIHILDETEYPLFIEAMQCIRIDKGARG